MSPDIVKALKHDSPLHKRLVEALKDRLKLSHKRFGDRHAQMADNEELFQAYIPTQEVDRLRKTNRRAGIPEYTTIELPYGYSVVMTMHTYFSSVFLSRNPIFQLAGRHGEAEQSTQAMETLLAYQMMVGNNILPLFIWLLDPGKYGYGVIGHYWDQETVRVRKIIEKQPEFLGSPIADAKPVKQAVVEEIPGYEGNRVYNVRPQDFYPDPRVALIHFQQGEFCGRYVEVAWNEIFVGSRHQSGHYRYFNYDLLRKQKQARDHSQPTGAVPRDEGSSNVTTLPGTGTGDGEAFNVPVGFIKGHELYIKLTPRDWGLGEEEFQEIWFFNISSNGVIFGAGPLEDYSGKFPFDLLTDEMDAYSIFPRSTLERVQPLQEVMTWLVNSHFYNVRQTLNNQFIVDPSMVVMKDVENPEPGKIIRLKPTAYGKDVRQALTQLQTIDVTRGHVQDLSMVMEMVQRMVPANDSIMGVQPGGSNRQTATSVRTSTHFSTSRLKSQCEFWSVAGFSPFSMKLVQRTQQMYDSVKKFRLVGDLAQFSTQWVEVSPDTIAGFYDYEPVDGTLPIDRFAQANLWQMILGQMQKHPQILMEYDIAKIFAWVAQLGGIKNLAQFRLTDQQKLMAMAQAGNVVPIGEAQKQIGNKNMQEPKQSPLAGPTG